MADVWFSTKLNKIDIEKVIKVLKEIPHKADMLYAALMSKIGEQAIKHASKKDSKGNVIPDSAARGKVVRAFKNMGIDLSEFVNNTERLPRVVKGIDRGEYSKGYTIDTRKSGNRLTLSINIVDFDRFFLDLLRDKRNPLGRHIIKEFRKVGVKLDNHGRIR